MKRREEKKKEETNLRKSMLRVVNILVAMANGKKKVVTRTAPVTYANFANCVYQ